MSWEVLREDARAIWQAGVDAVAPLRLLERVLTVCPSGLTLCGRLYDWRDWDRLLVVGAGKAGAGMGAAVEKILGPDVVGERLSGWINVPEDCVQRLQRIHLHGARPAGVNEPTSAGVEGTLRVLEIVQSATPRDLCLVLISGGGSALLPLPVEGISLEEKQEVTRLLMQRGATIQELNTVRKQISRVKGGGLARACRAGVMVSLILSDVIGDPLEIIASGPTVEDVSTPEAALGVLRKFGAEGTPFPEGVVRFLEQQSGVGREVFPKGRVENHVIGNNRMALEASAEEAVRRGYQVRLFETDREGSADSEGRRLVRECRAVQEELKPGVRPVCLLSGGEPTVKLMATEKPRKGGRNQQLILSALNEMWDEGVSGMALLSGGTDGEDGPTNAAGGFLDEEVWRRAHEVLRKSPVEDLSIQNAYPYLKEAEGLLVTGPTHTNVMDVRVGVVEGSFR